MNRRLENLIRSIGFKIIIKRLPKKSERSHKLSFFKTSTGNYHLPTDAHQDSVARAIKNNEIFDKEVISLAKKYIRPGSIVLDIGANFGQMSVLFSKMVGTKGKVHSFEADDFVYEILQKNIAENTGNVTTHYGAVHDKGNETLYFPLQDFKRHASYGSYGIDYINKKGRPIKTIKIDDIKFELPISFVKIDIQGGDLLAMKGAVNTIAEHKMPIIFEYEYRIEEEMNLSFQEYIDFVKSIGYKFERVVDGSNYLIVPR